MNFVGGGLTYLLHFLELLQISPQDVRRSFSRITYLHDMGVTELRFIHKLFREERCSSLYTFEESNTNNYEFTTILIQKYSSHFT